MSNNKENIACISANFVATNSAAREKAFIDLYGFGLARNIILHQGIDKPVIPFKDGSELNTEELRDLGLSYLATVLKKILSDTDLLNNEKRTIVKILKRRADPLRDEFKSYKEKYIT